MKQVQKVSVLNGLGETSTVNYKVSENVLKFIQTLCQDGLEIENLVESRVRLYKKMKSKILLTLPPDPKLMVQTIRRIHHQLYYWLRFNTKVIDVINMEKFWWSVEKERGAVTPAWFKGIFFLSLVFVTKSQLWSNYLILFLLSHILKQISRFFLQVCLKKYDLLLPPDVNGLSYSFPISSLQPQMLLIYVNLCY